MFALRGCEFNLHGQSGARDGEFRDYSGRLIDARLPEKPELSSTTLVEKYKLADQVTITCRLIPTFRDNATKLSMNLELTKLKFSRSSTPSQLEAAEKSPDWGRGGNLLHAPDALGKHFIPRAAMNEKRLQTDTTIAFEEIRDKNLKRAAHLPNFIADENADCYFSAKSLAVWVRGDSVSAPAVVSIPTSDRSSTRSASLRSNWIGRLGNQLTTF